MGQLLAESNRVYGHCEWSPSRDENSQVVREPRGGDDVRLLPAILAQTSRRLATRGASLRVKEVDEEGGRRGGKRDLSETG